MGLFRKGKTHIIAKFHRTDLVVGSHLGEGQTPTYSPINIVDIITYQHWSDGRLSVLIMPPATSVRSVRLQEGRKFFIATVNRVAIYHPPQNSLTFP